MSKNQDQISKYILEFSLLFCFMESLEFYWSLKLERKCLENIGFAENLDLPLRLLTFICSKSYNLHGFCFFLRTNWVCYILRQSGSVRRRMRQEITIFWLAEATRREVQTEENINCINFIHPSQFMKRV